MSHVNQFDLVIYHANCLDGFASAWVARMHSSSAVFTPATYGDRPPDVAGKSVLVCDFSYSRDDMIRMHAECKGLMVIDHHKTAAESLADLDFAVFDMDRSGAGLTWDTLFPDQPRPTLVDYVEDRDLWRFALPCSREFHASLSTIGFDFRRWDRFAEKPMLDVVAEGIAVLRYIKLTCEKIAERACIVEFGGYRFWGVNVPHELVSDTAQLLKAREPHLPILAWYMDGERGDYVCSLRSRDDGPDVSVIAVEWGGGHMHAAGFRSILSPVHR